MDAAIIKEWAPIALGLFAMITALGTAYFQYKSTKRQAAADNKIDAVTDALRRVQNNIRGN